ncbi:MAG: transketolase-like TK C-terminal-containing protein, partial [Desulfatiglandales bacterium]
PIGIPTRQASGEILNLLAREVRNLLGGSADLGPSNKTLIKGEKDFAPPDYTGRNLRFGVREHAMGAILNGMALHGGIIPYGGTFLIFSDYMRPAIRMAAMMGLKLIYVFTHDSIGLGEDGPTHQPVEQLLGLRSIPNLVVIRPMDANETTEAWKVALGVRGRPVALCLTRQRVPIVDRNEFASAHLLHKGAYILKEADSLPPDVILVSTGSEVHIALEVQRRLSQRGINSRLVSMPSWELFFEQPKSYKDSLFPKGVLKVSIEPGIGLGWERIVGDEGLIISLDRFGASAPFEVLYERFGFSAQAILERIVERLNENKTEGNQGTR